MACEWCSQTITSDRAWLREPIGAMCAGCCERWDGGERPSKMDLLLAAASTGSESTMRLAAQLAGAAPCPKCDYVASACRCPGPHKDIEWRRSVGLAERPWKP